jgi:hypothetical protein
MITAKNRRLIDIAIKQVKRTYTNLGNNGAWVCVGSLPTNLHGPASDIDLLFFSDALSTFERYVGDINEARLSVCLAPASFMIEDSYRGSYGGYFAAKLFNPFLLLSDNVELITLINAAPARYFFPYINYLLRTSKTKIDLERITAIALISFMGICPDFDMYMLRQFNNKNFSDIWQATVTQFGASIEAAGIDMKTLATPDAYPDQLRPFQNYEELYRDRVDKIANHWSFATYTHNGNYNFYKDYQEFAKKYIMSKGGYFSKDYEEMITFINAKTGLKKIYF